MRLTATSLRLLRSHVADHTSLATRQRVRRTLNPLRLGVLRHTAPISDRGWGRGTPIDRVYIESFLKRQAYDVRGRVLEVQDSAYTLRFGADVSQSDVLDIDADNPNATVVGDLSQPLGLPSDAFDCLIVTQTVQYVPHVSAAICAMHSMLRPRGVALVTVPGIAQVDFRLPVSDRWRMTPAACFEEFSAVFGAENTTVEAHGNVLAAVAYLSGLAAEELSERDLHVASPAFPVVVAIRAQKTA
jgi:SAM-dependent methyltransferase